MSKNIKNIKFENQQSPNTQFDIVKLKELFKRSEINHSIEAHHKVDFFILMFIEKGDGFHTIDFTDYKCDKGTLITIRKDQIHKFFKNKGIDGTMLIFTNEFLVSYLDKKQGQKTSLLFNEQLGDPKLQLVNIDFKNVQESYRRLESEYFKKKDNYSLDILRSELHLLILQLLRIKSKKSRLDFDKKYLEEFISFQEMVENNVTQTTRVHDYARMIGISTKTLNTITRTIVHKSAKEFIDEICTNQIKRLLINTELSIKEIAYQSGFGETTNFYKYFRRQTRTTPEKFRNT